ncbi:serine--tRNA ligase [Thermogymnomonas acidicola]|uniref:Serine--tRNA ligase n=1 Tax=Thermogymnomonas acidicola TaxID=399579 RepID=A0AA37F9I4_9ARCH|nr:serine--tRNA ligase [Thermogymnomonas acidicola]GGM73699.1 serine--tRNA ligase [Thermogymnomonas acidicola]
MIDVRSLREDPKPFYDSCRARGFDVSVLDSFFDLDRRWRENSRRLNELKHSKNVITAQVAQAVKSGGDAEALREKVKGINGEIEQLEREQEAIERERDRVLRMIPNLIHSSVPVCFGDDNNVVVRSWGVAKVCREDEGYMRANGGGMEYEIIEKRPRSHVDILPELNLVDLERAAKIAGSRFYFIKNRLLKLELALINYAIDFLSERGFSVVEPPFMLNLESMSGATDIETFRDTLYKIEGEDLYLISTSEHPIASMFSGEFLEERDLPMRVAGLSACFRREAGSHGKDTKGIFRVHQFNKVEQFVFCREDQSWEFLEEILNNAETIYRNLGIPYRVVNVCSGELGRLAAKKYDIEAWFPAQGRFREVVSASNDTDYQARALSIKYRSSEGNKFVHTLNSTAVATTRTLVAIVENFQRDDGKVIEVPKVLVPYTGFDHIGE